MAQIKKRKVRDGVRYDVRLRIDGRVVTKTFARAHDASAYATAMEADKLRGVAVDPRRAKVTPREYATQWLAGRVDLSERTWEYYDWLTKKKIFPVLGDVQLGKLTPSMVRAWNAAQVQAHPSTAAKAYRLLSQILKAAVTDEIITRNPCQIKGAGSEEAAERPVVTVAEIAVLADAMPEHLRAVVFLAAWCQLRRAEILGLRRQDVDLLHGAVSIKTTRTRMMNGRVVEKGPKTKSGRRTLAVPQHVVEELTDHLDDFVGPDPEDRLFPVSSRQLDLAWWPARAKIGRPKLRLHDLRHTGLTYAGATGATIAELMHRAGHSSPAAAIRYQHATRDRDRIIADALAEMVKPADVVPLVPRDERAMGAEGDGEAAGGNSA